MTDVRLSPNFLLRELEVSAQHPELVERIPPHLLDAARRLVLEVLQPIRDFLGRPVRVLSGYRPPRLNAAVGGSSTSQHRSAAAADFTTRDVREAFDALVAGEISVQCGQVIYYPGREFVHVALPSKRYPAPSFHVHAPTRGLHYHPVRSVEEVRKHCGR